MSLYTNTPCDKFDAHARQQSLPLRQATEHTKGTRRREQIHSLRCDRTLCTADSGLINGDLREQSDRLATRNRSEKISWRTGGITDGRARKWSIPRLHPSRIVPAVGICPKSTRSNAREPRGFDPPVESSRAARSIPGRNFQRPNPTIVPLAAD